MATYRVKWEIDVEADDAVAAALEAQACQLAPGSTANVFDVQDASGTSVQVDLQDQKWSPSPDTETYVYTQQLERTVEVQLTRKEWDDLNANDGELFSEKRERILYPAIQAQHGANWPWDINFEGEDSLEPKQPCFECGEACHDDECESCSIERQLDGDV